MASAPFLLAVIFTPVQYNSNRFQIFIAFLCVSYNSLGIAMKTQKHAGRLLARLRKAIGKSQTQFAAMLGVSKHTIISVENDRNRLSPKLAHRIRIATGAPIESGADLDLLERWASEKQFDIWRQKFKTDEETANQRYEDLAYWIRLVFRAAGRSGFAGNRDRLPAVYLSLLEWLNETREAFKLEREIDDILEAETRAVKDCHWTDAQLKKDEEHTKWIADELGISVAKLWQGFKKHKKGTNLVLLHAQLEMRDDWDPEAGEYPPRPTECKVKKLITKPKYWFEPVDRPTLPES
jgi:transcriptional regulator with XRE-family HTH domain